MSPRSSTQLLLLAMLGCSAHQPVPASAPAAPSGTSSATPPESPPPTELEVQHSEPARPERADVATPRLVEHPWMSIAEWRARHQRQLDAPGRSRAKLVFLGDSITEGWENAPAYEELFKGYEPLNLGIGGDQTQHVLWRIEAGTLRGVQAGLIVILIGVNNLGNGHSPEETLRGVQAVVKAVEQKLTETRILLLSILPAGELSSDSLRQKVKATNQLIESAAWSERVVLRDLGSALVEPGARIDKSVMADFLHPTNEGYARLSRALAPVVEEFVKP